MRAVVCGASKGIGRATAEMMVACGADVIALSRSAPEIPGARSISLDLEDAAAIEKTISGILVAGPIHILVNNAAGPPGGPLLDNDIADFEAPFKRHLHAAHQITRMVVPAMEEAGTGRIVNIISTSVREPIPNIGLSNTLRGAMASWAQGWQRPLLRQRGAPRRGPPLQAAQARLARAARAMPARLPTKYSAAPRPPLPAPALGVDRPTRPVVVRRMRLSNRDRAHSHTCTALPGARPRCVLPACACQSRLRAMLAHACMGR